MPLRVNVKFFPNKNISFLQLFHFILALAVSFVSGWFLAKKILKVFNLFLRIMEHWKLIEVVRPEWLCRCWVVSRTDQVSSSPYISAYLPNSWDCPCQLNSCAYINFMPSVRNLLIFLWKQAVKCQMFIRMLFITDKKLWTYFLNF